MARRHCTLAHTGFAAVALLAATLAPAFAQTPVRVALDGAVNAQMAPLLVAEDRGFYKAEGLAVSLDAQPSPPDALTRLASGAADAGLADINAMIRFREQNPGAPLTAVFIVTNKPAYAVIARKSRGIATPKDLEGKRIGAPTGEMASAFWPIFAKLASVDASRVKVETIAAAVREPMLAAGQIDAITGTASSSYLNLKERGVPLDDLVVLPMADYGLPLYGDAIVVNTAFAAEHPEAVKAFLRAFLKGLRETVKNPARAVDSVLKRNDSANKDIELERLRMAIQNTIVTDEVQAQGLGGVDAGRLVRSIELLTQNGKPKAKAEPADIFDASFLPPPAERKIGTGRSG